MKASEARKIVEEAKQSYKEEFYNECLIDISNEASKRETYTVIRCGDPSLYVYVKPRLEELGYKVKMESNWSMEINWED